MEDQLFETLIKTTYTVEDAYHRLALVRRFFEDALFKGVYDPGSFVHFLETVHLPPSAVQVFRTWGEAWLSAVSPDRLHEQFETVRARLGRTPKLTLSVPMILSPEARADLGTWLRSHTHPDILIELVFDVAAVGGCRITWQGKYRDFSLRYFVEQHRPQLMEVVRAM